jgi:hypothetical protein
MFPRHYTVLTEVEYYNFSIYISFVQSVSSFKYGVIIFVQWISTVFYIWVYALHVKFFTHINKCFHIFTSYYQSSPCYSILLEFIHLVSMFDLCQHHIDCLLCNIVLHKFGKRWVPNKTISVWHCVKYVERCLSTCSTVAAIALHHCCSKTKSSTVNYVRLINLAVYTLNS